MKIDIKNWINEEKEKYKQTIKDSLKIEKPSLLILQVGNRPESNSYVNGKLKDCEDIGISTVLHKVSPQGAYKEIKKYLEKHGKDYHGIILQEPSGFTEKERESILDLIHPSQDVDGFKADSWYYPCTPMGILEILENFYKKDGNIITVVGRGAMVGKPLIPMLVEDGWTVLCANSRTPDLKALTSMSDVVVTATGRRSLITRDMLKDGAFVIDAGIAFDENGKMCGDCDKAIYDDPDIEITTVPGGVGLVTRYMLVNNVIEAWNL